ncbi:hypothetical protein SK128_009736 [Halocaridina rubra]|uniref:Uncharacterized protein n=1 Tax=Halocaridina rubra TaxID=373956 RepID=A0AAN8XDT8_HALRR
MSGQCVHSNASPTCRDVGVIQHLLRCVESNNTVNDFLLGTAKEVFEECCGESLYCSDPNSHCDSCTCMCKE